MYTLTQKVVQLDPFQFKHPFRAMIAGPSMSGKSTLLAGILQENQSIITPPPTKIVYCYARHSPEFEKLKLLSPPVEMHEGLPNLELFDPAQNNLIILDDLISQVDNSRAMLNLFTTDSHHMNISVFIVTQNLYPPGKFTRTISLNCVYLIVFNNPRDVSQIDALARQMFPRNPLYFVECYDTMIEEPYGYLLCDHTQTTRRENRVQTGILNNEKRFVYRPITNN